MTADKSLKKFVEAELEFQPGIDSADIGVTVENGVVALTGHVPTYAQLYAVERVVKNLKGVRGIAQDLQVRPLQGGADSDDEIAARALKTLDWDVYIPKDQVKVRVSQGIVTLTGEVEWAYQRSAAESGVRNLRGVRGVFNQVTVRPKVKADDVKRRIKEALERQADLQADRITVTVEGGKVRLDGSVRAWRERDIAESAAWAAPGVQTVQDHIQIAF